TPVDLFVAIQTDRLFRAPGIRLAEVKQNKEKPAWYYILTWRSPALGGKMGSCHMIDLGLVFGTYEKKFTGEGPVLEALSAKMQDAWLAFAKNGDPTCESLDKWPSYGSKREIMMFGEKCYLENDPLSEERRAWDNIPLDVLG
ncbi:MAG: carboxylesterase family protein, partial [Dehalococcoidales bacterium]|nr:carboxylesterase family protein [Dehalococcoidales bacterium]